MIWVTRADGYHERYNRRWYEYATLVARSDARSVGARDVLETAAHEAAILSSNPINGQDNDFSRDLLRERVQSLLNSASLHVPTGHATFVRDRIPPLQTVLRDAGLSPIDLAAEPLKAKPGEYRDEHAARRGD